MEEHDQKRIRCPILGHQVEFKYCRISNGLLPCRRIAGCWRNQLDITGFLAENYSGKQLQRIFSMQKHKIQRLVNLIERSRKTG